MNAANQLQKLKTGVMEHDQCAKAHEDSGSPVIENNNVCAGGEEGTIIVTWNFEFVTINL